MTATEKGELARSHAWTLFAEGNTLAVRHGLYRERADILGEAVEALAVAILAERPDLGGVAFRWALTDWCREVIYTCALDELIGAAGVAGAEEGPRERWRRDRRAHARRAAEAARELGLSPRATAALARERVEAMRGAIDLDGIRERGRRLRLASGDAPGEDP